MTSWVSSFAFTVQIIFIDCIDKQEYDGKLNMEPPKVILKITIMITVISVLSSETYFKNEKGMTTDTYDVYAYAINPSYLVSSLLMQILNLHTRPHMNWSDTIICLCWSRIQKLFIQTMCQ